MVRSGGLSRMLAVSVLLVGISHLSSLSAAQAEEDDGAAGFLRVDDTIRANIDGRTEISPNGYRRESLDFARDTIDRLLSMNVETVREVKGWPVAPGDRHTIRFRLIQVYAPGSRVWVVRNGSPLEIPRSNRVHLAGASVEDPSIQVVLSIDPVSGGLRGSTKHTDREYRYVESGDVDGKRSVIADVKDLLAEHDTPLSYGCGFDTASWRELIDPTIDHDDMPGAATKVGALRQVVVAVDTDTEFNNLKFGDNEAAAEDWIADLFAEMTTLYERDLSLKILKGDTFLRHGADPYSVVGSPANSSQLSEFGMYWSANMGHVSRAFAMLLSGKSSSQYSASGIAWLDGYCEKQSTGGGYSVSQVFRYTGAPVTSDLRVIAHELGHNLGSPHTHCYNPPVDYCYACEGGCFSGTVSCPSGGQGTLMSYCHIQTNPASCSATCGTNAAQLHATVAALMDTYVAAHTPACVAVVNDNLIFDDGFESHDTDAWTSAVP